MAAPAIVSYGAALKIRAAATSGTYTEIPGCSDFDFSHSWNETDISAHDSTATLPVVERKKTMLDNGSLSFTLRLDYNQATHVLLFSAFRSTSAWGFEFTTKDPSADTATFLANVTEWGQAEPVDGVSEVSVTLSITGDITYA